MRLLKCQSRKVESETEETCEGTPGRHVKQQSPIFVTVPLIQQLVDLSKGLASYAA